MKKHLILLIYLCTSFAFSQELNDKKVFLDSLSRETTEGNHKYYRIIKDYNLDLDQYKVYDYYLSGSLQMEGAYKEKEALHSKGNFIYYYENGNKKKEVIYDNSKNIGPYTEWYENGIKKAEGEYIADEKAYQNNQKIINFWDENNKQLVTNGNGYIEYDTPYFSFKGNLKDGLRDGVWTGFNKTIKLDFTENYKKGQFVSGKSVDKYKIEHLYDIFEKQPEPKKGINDFYQFIGKKMKLPNLKKSVKGKILLDFVVEKNGEISNIVIIKSLGAEMDRAAIDVVNKYKDWIPGQTQGVTSRFRFSLPIMINYIAD